MIHVFFETWLYISWHSSVLLIKTITLNMSIDSSSWSIFVILMTTLTVNNRKTYFLKYTLYFSFFKFSIFITKVTKHFILFRFYWKCFSFILQFFWKSLGENKCVYSQKLLPFNTKSRNSIQNYPHIINFMLVLYT